MNFAFNYNYLQWYQSQTDINIYTNESLIYVCVTNKNNIQDYFIQYGGSNEKWCHNCVQWVPILVNNWMIFGYGLWQAADIGQQLFTIIWFSYLLLFQTIWSPDVASDSSFVQGQQQCHRTRPINVQSVLFW